MTEKDDASLIFDQGFELFNSRPELNENLARKAVRRLLHWPSETVAVDYSAGRKEIDASRLLAVSLELARQIRNDCPEPRIGIILPPGIGGLIANLAVALAGKSAANLNFTLGANAVSSCLEQAGLSTLLTAAKMRETVEERFGSFPWPKNTIDLVQRIQTISKPRVLLKLVAARLLPFEGFCAAFGIPEKGGNTEAALLFTSGSDTAPKGVPLTHRNIAANILQISESGIIPEQTSLLANLPIFHSFGFCVQVWVMLCHRATAVFVPSPLDFKKSSDAARAENCTLMLGTPTFYRPYLKRVPPDRLASLKAAIAGAEKTPDGFKNAWETRFPNCAYLEGYGMTEASPVVAVNTPDSRRDGSVGRLFSGMQVRVVEPDTRKPLPIGSSGLLLLRGPNLFHGYLNQPEKSAAVLSDDGWYETGDLGKIDEEGFLYIQGRQSRFSKIGGEMVSHGAVERAVVEALDLVDAELPPVAIGSRLDAEKGEALILLTTTELDLQALKRKLQLAGLSNLWIPKESKLVERIPVLPTGKLDLKAIRSLCTK